MKIVLKTLGISLLVVLATAFYVVWQGWLPTHADEPPHYLEKWVARKALHAAARREAPKGEAPIPADEDNLKPAVELYKVNCLVCHGGADGEASNVASGLYQKPPQFANKDLSDDSVGELYWTIKHGVRFTGMPAYSPTLEETQIWQLAVLLKHLDSLPPKVEKEWKKLPSAAEKD